MISPCIFVGFSSRHKGYKCLDPNGKLYVSRHIVFDEVTFPFAIQQFVVLPTHNMLMKIVLLIVQKPYISSPTSTTYGVPISLSFLINHESSN